MGRELVLMVSAEDDDQDYFIPEIALHSESDQAEYTVFYEGPVEAETVEAMVDDLELDFNDSYKDADSLQFSLVWEDVNPSGDINYEHQVRAQLAQEHSYTGVGMNMAGPIHRFYTAEQEDLLKDDNLPDFRGLRDYMEELGLE